MLISLLADKIHAALECVLPDAREEWIRIKPCPNEKFGDFQTNSLMAISKKRGLNPRQIAEKVVAHLDTSTLFESVDIAGPGFLNIKVKNKSIVDWMTQVFLNQTSLIPKTDKPSRVVIDFSSPNVAKPMHVGHIRSTILGDSLARIFKALGHEVITDNHLGDWGTQFGKLIYGWKHDLQIENLQHSALAEMERLYRQVNQLCESDASILQKCREELVKLQSGDPENMDLWKTMVAESVSEFTRVYQRLGVTFDFTLGESFYHDRLADVVSDLFKKGIVRESEGALVAFFDGMKELEAHPAMVRKSDGAYNYTSTDLATLQYRLVEWKPDTVIYVTDARQQLHFKQLFEIFRRWLGDGSLITEHVWFGSILGEDGKPFKTRSGDTIKLDDLLDEAEDRAYRLVTEKNPALDEGDRREIASVVALGAIKYADLQPNRQSDYVFSWDKMLSFNGNTAPYLLYAYTRIRSIFRNIEADGLDWSQQWGETLLEQREERMLALRLLNFAEVLTSVLEEYRPNYLCNYLYDLAGDFARFYENCPVLKAEEKVRSGRLLLCDLTGRTLKTGLDLLGIKTSERM